MTIFLAIFAGLALAASIGAIVVAARDGHRRVPTYTPTRWI